VADLERTIKLRSDTAGLREIQQATGKAFNRRVIDDFRRSGKELEREYAQLNRKIIDLSRSMRGLEKGTQSFKDMRKEMRGLQQDARMVQTAMSAIAAVTAQPGRGSFVAGLGQGTGLAQYIPTGPGQASRMAGAGIGGMLRRGAGMAAAPFQMPGVGGISQALGGIPIIGGFLAGALQQASGAYQAAVGYDRAALGALPYMGEAPTSAEQAAYRRRNLARAAAVRAQGQRQAAGVDVTAADRAQRLSAAASARARARGEFWAEAAPGATQIEPAAATLGGDPRNPKLIGGSPIDIEAQRKRIEIMKKADERASKLEKATLSRRGLPGAGAGVDFGISPGQMIQGFAQMMQARGGTFDDVNTAAYRQQMAAQTRYGVGAAQAGAFMRMGIAGGGGQGQMDLATVLQSAFEQGLRGSQVTEYLSTLVDLGRTAEQSGVKISEKAFAGAAATARGVGFQGLQAQRVAGGFMRAGMGISQRGVSKPMDLLMLRAAGWTPDQGAEGYAEAMGRLEEGKFDITKLMGDVARGGAGAGGPAMQALLMKRAMGQLGIQVGMGQTRRWAETMEGGELSPEAKTEIEAMRQRGMRAGAGGRLESGAMAAVKRGAGLAPGAASLEVQRIGAGRQAAGYIVGMERNAIATANVISNFGKDLQKLNGYVNQAIKALDKFSSGGLEALFAKGIQLFERLVSIGGM
jgi:exonuclease VII small subunit